MNTPVQRLLPQPTPETEHFWTGLTRRELLLQQCEACQHVYFPPRPFCPECASQSIRILKSSGKARLMSYIISARPAPGIEAPYVVAIVELEEGVRMMTNIVGVPPDPEHLVLDMPLKVVFEQVTEECTLPLFAPEDRQ